MLYGWKPKKEQNMNARTGRTKTNNVVDAEATLVRDPRKLGTEVRNQSHG